MFSTKSYLTLEQVAELLMVSPSVICLWMKKEAFKPKKIEDGQQLFQFGDIELFAQENHLQLNIEPDNKQRLLIVDDEPLYADFLKEALSLAHEELEIDLCFNGFAAGLRISSFKPTIVLLDLMMPAFDGFEVCEQMKKDPLLKHIRVIAMTGNLSPENKQRIMDSGAEACFSKPIVVSELIEQLDLD